jgi:hypothetical protein
VAAVVVTAGLGAGAGAVAGAAGGAVAGAAGGAVAGAAGGAAAGEPAAPEAAAKEIGTEFAFSCSRPPAPATRLVSTGAHTPLDTS